MNDVPVSFLVLTGLLIGGVLGSFITMLSYRLPRRQSIVYPPSHCPACGHRLYARDLVPLFSWLFARGKCRYCQGKISLRYPLIELVGTLSITACFVAFGFSWMTLVGVMGVVAALTTFCIFIERS